MQIISHKPKGTLGYTESPQAHLNYFALARKDKDVIHQLHPWVKCREYFNDAIVWNKCPNLFVGPQYGFVPVPDINLDKTEFLIRGYTAYLEKNLHILNDLEAELGLERTFITQVDKKDLSCYYIEADPWWMKTTLHISSYTLMLRTLAAVDVKDWVHMENNFTDLYSSLRGNLRAILHKMKETNYDVLQPIVKDFNQDAIHACTGIYTYVHRMMMRKLGSKVSNYNWGPLDNGWE